MKLLFLVLRITLLTLLIYSDLNYHQWLGTWGTNFELIDLIVGFFIFFLSADLVVVVLSWIYRQRKGMGEEEVDNIILALKNIYFLLVAGALVTLVIGLFGVDPKTLFTSLSIVAAAIAIISKDYISEIISGIIIGFSSHEMSIGDYIKIGAHKGKIIGMSLTKIAFLDEDDDIIYIPNSTVFSSEIVNYTKKQIRRVSLEFEVSLGAVHSIEQLEAELSEAIRDYHQCIEPGSFLLRVNEIRKDSLALKFQYVLKQINRELELEIRRKTVRRIVVYVKGNLGGVKG
ncbi:MAG: mechanosensitive ion channel [Saprospirales bacterium]|nr:mechanosensitive ion channel [Saprospirales bacterium]